jgi:hypothetical protein
MAGEANDEPLPARPADVTNGFSAPLPGTAGGALALLVEVDPDAVEVEVTPVDAPFDADEDGPATVVAPEAPLSPPTRRMVMAHAYTATLTVA